ncbi:MAG TPA: DUF1549 domain-containing protein, partial [Planctomycetota bacterium]|nr:DUF1549 domain-containing protein [Planctomycetota bacterium]
RYADGTTQDATALALYASNDDGVATVSKSGSVRVVGAGETAILVRFLGRVAAARVRVPFAAPYAPRAADGLAEIDRLVEAKAAAMGVPLSPPASDATFLRRATLDLAGRLPTPEEIAAFAADRDPGKRHRCVDRLLASDRAVAHWTRWLSDLVRVRDETMNAEPASALHRWLRERLAERAPLDAVVRELVTARGATRDGPAAFAIAGAGPKEQMELVTRTFLGIRLQCAQCHQHPYDRWSRDDYFGAASYFARVRHAGGRVSVVDYGELTDPRTGRDAAMRLPGAAAAPAAAPSDRRAAFADWMLDRDAMRFDRSIANRVWKQLLGAGLVEPVDDLRDGNPPLNPELLDALARRFRDGGRQLFPLVRAIATSDAYARDSAAQPGNERDLRYGSRALVRALPASVLLDAMADATAARVEFPSAPDAKRAVELADDDGGSYTLRVLGQCPRDGSRDPSVVPAPGVPAALHLLHGPMASSWLASPGGRVASIQKRRLAAREAVEECFLATLSRAPSPAELERARAAIGDPPTREGLEDLLWSLLASTEFAMNH